MTPPPKIIGVDLGGTWIRLQALDASGRPLWSLKQSTVSHEALAPFLKRVWKKRGRPEHLAVASRGIWTAAERSRFKKRLCKLASHVTVMSDVEAAWLGSFGTVGVDRCRPGYGRTHSGAPLHSNNMGILVISGTGSIAYARDSDGCARRAGGLGPLLGDEGSAFWIGRAWLRQRAETASLQRVLHLLRQNPFPVRRIAALATQTIRRAREGDRNALMIIREAQGALANLVAESVAAMHFQKIVPVSWAGSVLNDPWFRVGFTRTVRRHPGLSHRTILWQEPRTNAATAIANHALYG